MSGLRIRDRSFGYTAVRHAGGFQRKVLESSRKMASGQRINSAGDDAAGLAISDKIRQQRNGLNRAEKNAQDAVSLIQTAESGIRKLNDIVQRLKTLAVQSASDTLTDADRSLVQKQASELIAEYQRITTSTTFNGQSLLDSPLVSTSNAAVAAASTGSALGFPWAELKNAIDALSTGVDQTVDFTVSFITPPGSTEDGAITTAQDQTDSNPATSAFQADVMSAFNEWKRLFERIYSRANGAKANLTINFTNLGAEKPNSVPSDPAEPSYTLPHPDGIGDFRVTVVPLDGIGGTLAHGFSPSGTPGSLGNVGGDIHFDSAENFRVEGNAASGDFSVKHIAVHEIGHALGLGHDTSNSAIMFPLIGAGVDFADRFPNGLPIDGSDAGSIMNVYGVPGEAAAEGRRFHVGANQDETILLAPINVTASQVGLSSIDLTTRNAAEKALTTVNDVVDRLTAKAAELGAEQNRFEKTIDFVKVSEENSASAESQIRDLDFANETTNLARNQILAQSSSSVVSQANLLQSNMLQLLGLA
ncbi:MAG: hypothetical protein D6679_10370 [Candidatus Hydrogenedentota bacterium]|nr:MAG: hypothetical protein D6679_10370 [Candidatus Hydrogenedentota bacterium]